MNDSTIVRKLKQLDNYRQKIDDIIREISDSNHPKADAIADALWEQCWFPAWPEHVVGPELLANPDRWELESIERSDGKHILGKLQRKR